MKYGMLEVIGLDPDRKYHMLVRCECGTEKSVYKGNLFSGGTQSCGCAAKLKTSNVSKTPTYRTWESMLRRIRNPNCPEYSDYGGRGLRVDPAWEKFENFYADMGQKPEGNTLERLNTNGDYCKENCVWATVKEQANNKRNSIRYDYLGQKLSINQLVEISGISYATLWMRLKVGMSVKDAAETPLGASLPKRGNVKEFLYNPTSQPT